MKAPTLGLESHILELNSIYLCNLDQLSKHPCTLIFSSLKWEYLSNPIWQEFIFLIRNEPFITNAFLSIWFSPTYIYYWSHCLHECDYNLNISLCNIPKAHFLPYIHFLSFYINAKLSIYSLSTLRYWGQD